MTFPCFCPFCGEFIVDVWYSLAHLKEAHPKQFERVWKKYKEKP